MFSTDHRLCNYELLLLIVWVPSADLTLKMSNDIKHTISASYIYLYWSEKKISIINLLLSKEI